MRLQMRRSHQFQLVFRIYCSFPFWKTKSFSLNLMSGARQIMIFSFLQQDNCFVCINEQKPVLISKVHSNLLHYVNNGLIACPFSNLSTFAINHSSNGNNSSERNRHFSDSSVLSFSMSSIFDWYVSLKLQAFLRSW